MTSTEQDSTIARVTAILKSATVQRYHTENTVHKQSVGEHTYDVMWLVYLLTNGAPSVSLLLAALMHDTPEYVTGDIPAPVKSNSPAVKHACDDLEAEWFEIIGIEDASDQLTKREKKILKTADVLSGCLFCMNEWLRGNRHIAPALHNYVEYAESLCATPGSVEFHILSYVKEKTKS